MVQALVLAIITLGVGAAFITGKSVSPIRLAVLLYRAVKHWVWDWPVRYRGAADVAFAWLFVAATVVTMWLLDATKGNPDHSYLIPPAVIGTVWLIRNSRKGHKVRPLPRRHR